MASNKHHELAKRVMNQVGDLLPDHTIKQANKFVMLSGCFPKIIKFDYVGKWRLKGKTRLYIEAGLEVAADFTYFNTNYTWINTKRKHYITNFGRYRNDLVPNTDEEFFSEAYELTLKADGQVDVDLIRHEIIHYFLPYLERLNALDDLITLLHWHKPTDKEMLYGYRHHSFFWNWLTVIYLLLTERRSEEAELCIEKINNIAYSLDQSNLNYRLSEGLFVTINKLQTDFTLSRSYRYDEEHRCIVAE